MTSTISGHPAIVTSSDTRLVRQAVPGTDWTLTAHRSYAPILASVAAAWHREVAPLRLDPLECWSYAYRKPRAGSGVSDHAGYAIDLNSAHEGAQGPYGGMLTMTRAQKDACRAIADRYRPVVFWGGATEWGGQYTQPRYWDPMHWYIRPGATPTAAAELLASLEDDVALSDEDVQRIADAVWTRLTPTEVDGKKRKMGSLLIALFRGTAPPATDEDNA